MTLDQLLAATSDEVVAEIRKQIRKRFGDAVENVSSVYASHGYYYVNIERPDQGRKTTTTLVDVKVRRKALPDFFKGLRSVK